MTLCGFDNVAVTLSQGCMERRLREQRHKDAARITVRSTATRGGSHSRVGFFSDTFTGRDARFRCRAANRSATVAFATVPAAAAIAAAMLGSSLAVLAPLNALALCREQRREWPRPSAEHLRSCPSSEPTQLPLNIICVAVRL